MARFLNGMTVLGGLLALGLCATPAMAAKGIKKNQEHHISGKVVSVQPAGKGKEGTLTIHVTHHKHKKGTAVATTKGTNKTFTINAHTKVDVGPKGKNLGLSALRPGEHVTVFAHQHHADKVVIHHHKKTATKIAKR